MSSAPDPPLATTAAPRGFRTATRKRGSTPPRSGRQRFAVPKPPPWSSNHADERCTSTPRPGDRLEERRRAANPKLLHRARSIWEETKGARSIQAQEGEDTSPVGLDLIIRA